MVFLVGLSLIGLIALVGLACRRAAASSAENDLDPRPNRRRPLWRVAGYTALAVALVILLFRPDEEMESGEDPGAYFLAALSYAAQQSLTFPDPALADLPPGRRSLFRYGHRGFLRTKDAVLWSRDREWSEVGPHFFPAYSVLLSVPAALGVPYAAFWTSPVFAILVGGLLALLAVRLTGKPLAGWLAFSLFILNPAVIWNARCLRAEWPASFLALAGLVLWSARGAMDQRVPAASAFLGGLALAAAGWFHVTAFMVLIPTFLASLWQTRRTAFWASWWSGLLLGCGLLLAQVIWITDPYWLKDLWGDIARRNAVLLLGVLSLLVVAGLRWICHRPGRPRLPERFPAGRLAGGLFSLAYLLIVLLSLGYRNDQGMLPGLPAWTATYHSLTDFHGVRKIFSWTGFWVALAGMVVLCVRSGTPGRLGRRIFLVLAPASLTIGWVINYMFETRRMITFLVPLFVLSTAVLLVTAGAWVGGCLKRSGPGSSPPARLVESGLPVLLTVVLLSAGFWSHGELYTTWNNRGTYRYYRDLAGEVKAAGDFLMAEYTPTAAPLERLSGLPLLPIAWGYRSETEYREAERVLARLVREHPDRRYLLLSPFSGAALPGVRVEPLFSRKLETIRLARARRSVPEQILPRPLTLRLHRLLPPDGTDHPGSYTRIMDRGRLGLAGGANFFPARTITIRGIALGPETTGKVTVRMPEKRSAGSLFLVVARPGPEPPEPLAVGRFPALRGEPRQFPLGPGWDAVELKIGTGAQTNLILEMRTPVPAYLTDLFWVDDSDGISRRVRGAGPETGFQVENVDSQWLLASSAVALPAGPQSRWLWLLATPGREAGTGVQASVRLRGGETSAFIFPLASGWNWHLIPIPSSRQSRFKWYDIEVSPPWDPGLRNFPSDLGFRLHLLTVVPEDG
jgi:hypothetical protein